MTPIQARSKETRRRLLEAASACLCERGFAGTTTTAVAERAEVSQGALYKHFGSKHLLVAATMERLFGRLIDDFRRAFAQGAGEQDPLSRALPALWAVFLSPELYAVVELYIAARTDEALRLVLAPVLDQHRSNLHEEARKLFPVAAKESPRFAVAVDTVMAAMQGAAVSAAVMQDLPGAATFASYLEEVCRRELEPPYGVDS